MEPDERVLERRVRPRSALPMTERIPRTGEPPDISVVVPLYNEQENVGELHHRLELALRPLGTSHEIVFVDDGSRDETLARIEVLRESDVNLAVVHLSRNFGHQAAISA